MAKSRKTIELTPVADTDMIETPETEVVGNFDLVEYVSRSGLPEKAAQSIIEKFSGLAKTLDEMNKRADQLVITSEEDVEKMAQAKEAKKIVASLRIDVEKTRKQITADPWNEFTLINSVAKVMTAMIAPIEQKLEDKANYAKKLQLERMEKLRAERSELCKDLWEYIPVNKDLGAMGDQEFKLMLAGANSMRNDALKALEEEEAAKQAVIEKAAKEKKLHDDRRELILDFWVFASDKVKNTNLGSISEEEFAVILEGLYEAKKAKDEADAKALEEKNAEIARLEKADAVRSRLEYVWPYLSDKKHNLELDKLTEEEIATLLAEGLDIKQKEDLLELRTRELLVYELAIDPKDPRYKPVGELFLKWRPVIDTLSEEKYEEVKASLKSLTNKITAEIEAEEEEAIKARLEKEAEEKKEKEKLEKEAAEAEAKKRELNAPDKEKLLKLAKTLQELEMPVLQAQDGQAILNGVTTLIGKVVGYIKEKSDLL